MTPPGKQGREHMQREQVVCMGRVLACLAKECGLPCGRLDVVDAPQQHTNGPHSGILQQEQPAEAQTLADPCVVLAAPALPQPGTAC